MEGVRSLQNTFKRLILYLTPASSSLSHLAFWVTMRKTVLPSVLMVLLHRGLKAVEPVTPQVRGQRSLSSFRLSLLGVSL